MTQPVKKCVRRCREYVRMGDFYQSSDTPTLTQSVPTPTARATPAMTNSTETQTLRTEPTLDPGTVRELAWLAAHDGLAAPSRWTRARLARIRRALPPAADALRRAALGEPIDIASWHQALDQEQRFLAGLRARVPRGRPRIHEQPPLPKYVTQLADRCYLPNRAVRWLLERALGRRVLRRHLIPAKWLRSREGRAFMRSLEDADTRALALQKSGPPDWDAREQLSAKYSRIARLSNSGPNRLCLAHINKSERQESGEQRRAALELMSAAWRHRRAAAASIDRTDAFRECGARFFLSLETPKSEERNVP